MAKTEYAQPYTTASYEAARAYGTAKNIPPRVMSAARSPTAARNTSAAQQRQASTRQPQTPRQIQKKRQPSPQQQGQQPRQTYAGRDSDYFTRDSGLYAPTDKRRAARTVSDLDTAKFTRPLSSDFSRTPQQSRSPQQIHSPQQSRSPQQIHSPQQSRSPQQIDSPQQSRSSQQIHSPQQSHQPQQSRPPQQSSPTQQSRPAQQSRATQQNRPAQQSRPQQQNRPAQQSRPAQQIHSTQQSRPAQQSRATQQSRPTQQNRSSQQTLHNGFIRRERAPGERPLNKRKTASGAKMQPPVSEKTTFERARQKKQRSKAFRAVSAALMLMVLTVTAFAVIYETLFGIDMISVTGLTKYKESVVIGVSGLSPGDKLWSFSANRTEAAITLACPYIKSVTVRRIIPNAVVLGVSEDSALYYADILGERFILNADCKVLALTSTEVTPTEGLIKLKLPDVKRAIAGRTLVYKEDWPQKYISECLAAVSSSGLFGRLDMIDLRNRYDLIMTSDKKYLLILGTADDVEIKLMTAERILEDELFSTGNKASVDLTNLKESSVIIDNQLDLS